MSNIRDGKGQDDNWAHAIGLMKTKHLEYGLDNAGLEGCMFLVSARMHFTGLYWFRLSFMGGFASKYFHVELDMM